MMKVFVDPPAHLSRAMRRVAGALRVYSPRDLVKIVNNRRDADLEVLHVIGLEAIERAKQTTPFAVVQYCVHSTDADYAQWRPLWDAAKLTWSYYKLDAHPFYHAPLGVDQEVFSPSRVTRTSVMTSGYVSGPGAEAIEEMATAARLVGLPVTHLGPVPVHSHDQSKKMDVGGGWRSVNGINDEQLAQEYSRCLWVSGLRHVEGFELPVIEGLLCGARPIVFDRDDMHQWYKEHAVFVPECSGETLVKTLVSVLSQEPAPVLPSERDEVARKFDWRTIAEGFWSRLIKEAA